MHFRSILFIAVLIPTLVWGQDSIPVRNRLELSLSPSEYFLPYSRQNPALAKNSRNFSLVDMNLNISISDNKNQLPQLGDGFKQAAFDAEAQMRLKNNDYIWGKAFYKNGKKDNIQWNESADFLKLYPYVALDTIGGDLNYEQYYFQGGYAKDYNRFSWGISADFKEGMEYRKKDPRPKNLTSELNADLGGSWKYSSGYSLAANIHLEKYKQDNSVSFFGETGSAPIYNTIGLGLLNNRFWSNQTGTYFSGSGYGGSLSLISQDLSGFSANISYNHSKLSKRITNPAKIDLNRTVTQVAEGALSYLKKSEKRNFGLNLSAKYNNRMGYESIVGDIVSGAYEILGENQPYKSEYKQISISGLYEKKGVTSWSVQPEFSAGELKVSYSIPYRLMQVSFWQPRLKASFYHVLKKSVITFNLTGIYHNTFNEKLEVNSLSGDVLENRQPLYDTYHSLTSNYTGVSLNTKYYHLHSNNLGIYLQLSGEQRWYEQQSANSHTLFLALGIIF